MTDFVVLVRQTLEGIYPSTYTTEQLPTRQWGGLSEMTSSADGISHCFAYLSGEEMLKINLLLLFYIILIVPTTAWHYFFAAHKGAPQVSEKAHSEESGI